MNNTPAIAPKLPPTREVAKNNRSIYRSGLPTPSELILIERCVRDLLASDPEVLMRREISKEIHRRTDLSEARIQLGLAKLFEINSRRYTTLRIAVQNAVALADEVGRVLWGENAA